MENGKRKRARRKFTDEFKAGAVALVLDQGKSVAQVARDLDLTASALTDWVARARADRTGGKTGLTTEERAELSRLRKENRELKLERELLKKLGGLLREGERVKFAFVDGEKANFKPGWMCRRLGVSPSGYYAWRRRPESHHAREDRRLAVLVREAHEVGRRYYGSPRVHAELAANDEHVSRKRVARLMQQEGLKARVRRRYKNTTDSDHDQPIAPNLLGRQFEAAEPNQRWVCDTTELLVGAGKLYLAVVLDLFSRFVVGWALSAVNDRHLTMKALDQALRRRCPDAGLLHHSDQGSPYASDDYRKILTRRGITCSMSRRGNCLDNAAMESWFSTLKSERGEQYDSPTETKDQLFDYIEVFYNQQRRHSTLGYLSPAEFERQYWATDAAVAA
ncbi:MAG: IS3 family transposase [bacterium]